MFSLQQQQQQQQQHQHMYSSTALLPLPLPLPLPTTSTSGVPIYPQHTPPFFPPADTKASIQPYQHSYLPTPTTSQQQQQHLQQACTTSGSVSLLPPPPLAIDTSIVTAQGAAAAPDASYPLLSNPTPSSKTQQLQSVSELAEFAAHMVCYLLYGHQPKSPHHSGMVASPASMPSSPAALGASCPCGSFCAISPKTSGSSVSSTYTYPTWPQQCQDQHQKLSSRPTHRRVISESDIVQPKPMFRKFCLDVLSATLLSPSVILLSLKYIRKLMLNLKSSNKIVNTGDGAEYRFFTGALILANKFLDDNTFTNKTWADITGMKIKDVNHLEMQFLSGIDFRLFTSPSEYSEWLASLTQFTGQYMPSQHQVAHQQQTTAARSPISPVDTAPADLSIGCQGSYFEVGPSGVVSSGSAGSVMHSTGSHAQPAAPMPLSMASISNYIDSVKLNQNRTVSGGQFQRVPACSAPSFYHPTHTPANSIDALPSQQYQPFYGPGAPLTPYSQSPVTPGSFSCQQNPAAPMHRKRPANIAFEDTVDHSPAFGTGILLPNTSRPSAGARAHKRFSSSSSAITLMGHGSDLDMFRGGRSPVQSQQFLNQPRRHQRTASGGYYMEMAPEFASLPSQLNGASSVSKAGKVHPLDSQVPQETIYRPSSHLSGSYPGFQTIRDETRPQSQSFDHPVTPPSYYDLSSGQHVGMASGYGGDHGRRFEVDPRLWGPLDSISLYAITTQAAKRVVAQSRALSSSVNTLHMYYPTTLA
ncbi:hypothetical protein EMPS_08677 [Entomortierella parvispora]|uniref:Cyclin-like domain-containing protein n=1 Tax=Entomortierella parvispora TaxID=205924 RepID=A0A9P3HGV0_9FUNG|nr:hypothetical protein EMPS_08677 [Entomortierella parvispora]